VPHAAPFFSLVLSRTQAPFEQRLTVQAVVAGPVVQMIEPVFGTKAQAPAPLQRGCWHSVWLSDVHTVVVDLGTATQVARVVELPPWHVGVAHSRSVPTNVQVEPVLGWKTQLPLPSQPTLLHWSGVRVLQAVFGGALLNTQLVPVALHAPILHGKLPHGAPPLK